MKKKKGTGQKWEDRIVLWRGQIEYEPRQQQTVHVVSGGCSQRSRGIQQLDLE